MPDPRQPNRLIGQKSPYLLQHAWNPVDWRPWGEEAFEAARRQDRPIFLSVGYSTCHWCHVMERESFEDEATAAILNSRFVPVKVDREEMPDIDRIYMLFVQATTGSGGWPMSVWLTPSLKPLYGGSYFPPVERLGRPSFRSVLETLATLWQNDRERLLDNAGSMMRRLLELARPPQGSGELTERPAARCLEELERSFDPEYGGFGGAPKFPRPALLRFLLGRDGSAGKGEAARMALVTLDRMAAGGIHDHLGIPGKGGGGFSRYSTDRHWQVPHFEKMLYDNAQLADIYLRAFQRTREARHAEAARDIFNYVLTDLRSPEGAFLAAEDADSRPAAGGDAREGEFYLWSEAEVSDLLGMDEARLFCMAYGIRGHGNAIEDPHGEFAGRNVLFIAEQRAEVAAHFGITPAEASRRLDAAREALFEARSRRPRPLRDGKVVTAWNGLMVSALARGAAILGDRSLLDAAKLAVEFVLEQLYVKGQGRLFRSWCDGVASIPGKAADYADMVQGLIDLYEATLDAGYLGIALELAESQVELFADRAEGGFYSSASYDELAPLRLKEDEDGAEPSANSVSAMNLLRLSAMTGREELRRLALSAIRNFTGILERAPTAMPLMLVALDAAMRPGLRVVLAGEPGDERLRELHRAAFRHDRSDMVLMHGTLASSGLLPDAWATVRAHQGAPAAFVCSEGCCRPPAYDPDALGKLLEWRKEC